MPTRCSCLERKRAQQDGWFIWDALRDAWVFTDGPIRTMSVRAAYFAGERGVENHTGEPYAWSCCPFCGDDLPLTAEDIQRWDMTDDEPE